MRRFLQTIVAALLFTITAAAQEQDGQRFSPEKFETELRQYITTEAKLTQQEADRFFSLYKEMQEKQRTLFDKQRNLWREKPADEQGCLRVLRESDEVDIELKRIQQQYHQRFLEQMSASKLYDVLKAEQRFHRRMMKNWNRPHNSGSGRPANAPGSRQHGSKK